MNDLLHYDFEDVRRRQLRAALVGATEVAIDRLGVVGFRKDAWGGKSTPPSIYRLNKEFFVVNFPIPE